MLKYIGNGSFLPGVPARDLTDAEVRLYGGERLLLRVGIYAEVPAVEQPEKHRSAERKPGALSNPGQEE